MVAAKWNKLFKALAEPESSLYVMGGTILMEHTLRETLDIIGATEDLTPFERYELGWAFGMMDGTDGLVESLTSTLRTAVENKLPIIFTWEERITICTLSTSIAGGKVFVTLGTPALDKEQLPSLFSGGFSSSVKIAAGQ